MRYHWLKYHRFVKQCGNVYLAFKESFSHSTGYNRENVLYQWKYLFIPPNILYQQKHLFIPPMGLQHNLISSCVTKVMNKITVGGPPSLYLLLSGLNSFYFILSRIQCSLSWKYFAVWNYLWVDFVKCVVVDIKT